MTLLTFLLSRRDPEIALANVLNGWTSDTLFALHIVTSKTLYAEPVYVPSSPRHRIPKISPEFARALKV